MRTASLVTAAEDSDPRIGLRAVVAMRTIIEELEVQNVARARREGWSWQEIGDALGVSKQAAHKKHGRIGVE